MGPHCFESAPNENQQTGDSTQLLNLFNLLRELEWSFSKENAQFCMMTSLFGTKMTHITEHDALVESGMICDEFGKSKVVQRQNYGARLEIEESLVQASPETL